MSASTLRQGGLEQMPKTTKTLNIPHGGNLTMNKNQNNLLIHVTQACQWCYSDPNGVFSSLPPAGPISPGDYGPYDANGDGTVTYGDPINAPCNTAGGPSDTPHTITVSG
jgi:hypothetical protein